MTQERRQFARIHLEARVRVTLPDVEERRQLLLDNLSEGGLFLRTREPKPVGTKLRFEFFVRDGGDPIEGAGVVRWVENDPEGTPGMGIQFTELNETGRKEIAEVLRTRRIEK